MTTKAEAYVAARTLRSTDLSEPFWVNMGNARMDHKSLAMARCSIYHRRTFVDGLPHDTHRLVCFSYYGDSILWESISKEVNLNPPDKFWTDGKCPWALYNCRYLPYGANSEGNIEFAYDHVLPLIHPE